MKGLGSNRAPIVAGQGLATKSASGSKPTQDGLVIWLEADRGVTLTGGRVTSWRNQVSADVVAASAGIGPVFNATGSGSGKAALEFTGTESLSNGTWHPIADASPRTYLAAFTPAAGSPNGGTIVMIGSTAFSTTIYGDGGFGLDFVFTDGAGNQTITDPVYGTPMVGSWQCTAGSLITFQRNGVVDATVAGAVVASPVGAGVLVGSLAAASSLNLRGTLSGILGYDKILSAAELAHDTAYLAKYT